MNDLAKMFAAAAGGAIAMHLYMGYQGEQARAARMAAQSGRSPAQRLTDSATSAIRVRMTGFVLATWFSRELD